MLAAFERVRTENAGTVGLISLPRALNVHAPAGLALVRAESGRERDVAIMCAPEQVEALRSAARELNASTVPHSRLLCGAADYSVVKSGTSTLEAGLSGQPLCAMYRSGAISYLIARTLVNIPVFSLVNIVLGQYAVPELLQGEVTPKRLAAEIQRGLRDETYRAQQRAALAEIPKRLGGPGASARAATEINDFVNRL
jgi:lipid A disaccharide synthetase